MIDDNKNTLMVKIYRQNVIVMKWIYGLFNDTVSNSDSTVSDDRMIKEE
jgi:hypothetical protein